MASIALRSRRRSGGCSRLVEHRYHRNSFCMALGCPGAPIRLGPTSNSTAFIGERLIRTSPRWAPLGLLARSGNRAVAVDAVAFDVVTRSARGLRLYRRQVDLASLANFYF